MSPRKGPLVVVGDTLLDRDLAGTVTHLGPDAPAPPAPRAAADDTHPAAAMRRTTAPPRTHRKSSREVVA